LDTPRKILIVVPIVALLGWLAISNRDDVATCGLSAAKADMNSIKTALLMYRQTTGRYPTTAQGLNALVVNPGVDHWRQAMETLVKDCWGVEYQYVCPGIKKPNTYDIFSAGKDMQPNTPDDVYPD
jgi:general secretion pathway protein G